MKKESNYPKDMNDQRWFDRDFGKENEIVLPEWLAMIVFFPAVVFQLLLNSFYEIKQNLQTLKGARLEKKLIENQEALAILEMNSGTSSLERRSNFE